MGCLDLFFPKNCLECKKAGKYICMGCLARVERAKLICPVCKKYSFNGKTHTFCVNKYALCGMHSFYKHEGVIRGAILALKYRFASAIAEELVDALPVVLGFKNAILLPVPLHKKREKWRGFNQAAILGQMLADKNNWGFNESLLHRVEDTTPQVTLGKAERLQNIRGKFAVNEKALGVVLEAKADTMSQPTFIVFDDVWTTGATINEAAKVLKKEGFKDVWGMSVARS